MPGSLPRFPRASFRIRQDRSWVETGAGVGGAWGRIAEHRRTAKALARRRSDGQGRIEVTGFPEMMDGTSQNTITRCARGLLGAAGQ